MTEHSEANPATAEALCLYDAARDLIRIGEAELAPIDAWTAWQQLQSLLTERAWPQLTTTAEPQRRLRCPWCAAEFDEPPVEEMATRYTFLDVDWQRRSVRGQFDGDAWFKELWFCCPDCARPVSLPEGWTPAWRRRATP